MKKSNIKPGQYLLQKCGRIFSVEEINKNIYLRFHDGTNTVCELNSFDNNMNHPIDNWSIVKKINYKPILFDNGLKEFNIINLFSKEEAKCIFREKEKYADGFDVKKELVSYAFNENEGRKFDEFEETIKLYYIFSNGKKIYIEEDDYLIIKNGSKKLMTYDFLVTNYSMQ